MTNMRFNRITSDGTRHILKQWRRGVSREDERIELTKALHAAKLVNLVDLYLSEGVAEEQIDSECANEDDNDQQLSNRDDTSLEQDRTKGHTDIQVLQEATASSYNTPLDGHTGDTASKTQEDSTNGSRSQHLDQSPDNSHVGGIISNEEDLISQLVLIDTFPEKILLLFLVKIIMDVSQKALSF
eukprot:XP_011673492.1 PREDICTED: uncharacterized protein LOC105442756 [Strongylocentrotus purpuratus]